MVALAGFHPIATARTMFVDEIDGSGIGTMLERLETSTAMMRAVQIRVLGGAMARVPDDAEEHEAYAPWVADLAAQLQRGAVGAYVGFLGDEGEDRVNDAYPKPTRDRLAEVKARYDPKNLFRLNQNIRPAR